MTSSQPFPCPDDPGTVHLRLMETSDLHVHILPFDYYRDRPAPGMGLARTASLIAECRKETPNTLLFDNGDFLQGNPVGDYMVHRWAMAPRTPHPMIAAMNALSYDAATLGNHEFNYGVDFLEASLADAGFPLVCANAALGLGATALDDRTMLPPYVLLDREVTDGAGGTWPLRIGVIGFLPPQVTHWDRAHLEGRIVTRDIVGAARAWVPRMRAEGADIVVALVHSGIGADAEDQENVAIPLARVPGIDALLTGHTHQVFPSPVFEGLEGVDVARGTICGKPAVMPGFWGSHLGVIDLALSRTGTGWRIGATRSRAIPIADRREDGSARSLVSSDDRLLRLARPAHLATRDFMRRTVGASAGPLHSYFALVGDCAALQIVCDAQAAHVAAALEGTEHAHLPVLSAAAPFKAGGRGGPRNYTDIPAGGLVLRHVADLYAFPNAIRAVRATGADVAEWLELSARAFRHIPAAPGDHDLIEPDFPSYNFDVIGGLTYRIDPTRPPRYSADGVLCDPASRRIRDLCISGRPLDPAEEVIVATNSYRVDEVADAAWAQGIRTVYEAPILNRDILLRHISSQGRVKPSVAPNWSFVPHPGHGLLFTSAPAARTLLADGALPITAVGPAEDGFWRYRLRT